MLPSVDLPPGSPERPPPLVVGHRGAMGYAPENTLASFELALQLGADAIELDVHLSRDGEVVVIHDERLERTTDGLGLVGERTLAELRQLDAGAWFDPRFAGQRIPTLDDVLIWATKGGSPRRAYLTVEIKNGPIFYAGIEAKVLDLLKRHRMRKRALVISFDHHTVRRVRELDSVVQTGILYTCRPVDFLALASAAEADVLLPHWSFVTAEDVATAHANNIRVSPWATSDVDELRTLVQAGVDAIATNHPDVLVKLLGKLSDP